MRQRPKIALILAAFLLLVAVSFPMQIMALYGHGFSEISAILSKLTVLNWLVMFSSLICGGLFWQSSSGLRYAVPTLILLVAVNNFFVGYYATDYSPWVAALATMGFASIGYPVFKGDVRWLMENPEMRWWRAATRKRMSVPIFVGGRRHVKLRTETFDISESGVFISARNESEFQDLKLSDPVTICLTLGMFTQIRCDGRVARISEANGIYPAGIGIEFINLPWHQRRDLRKYLLRSSRKKEEELMNSSPVAKV